jgi:hypothetical protein
MKQGTRTTEFWVSIAPVLIGMVEGYKGDTEMAKWLIVCGTVLGVLYIASRTVLKVVACKQTTDAVADDSEA